MSKVSTTRPKLVWNDKTPVSASTIPHPNTKCNFKVGYHRQVGIVSTQMQANREVKDGHNPNDAVEMKNLRDKYKKRRNQTTFQLGSKYKYHLNSIT